MLAINCGSAIISFVNVLAAQRQNEALWVLCLVKSQLVPPAQEMQNPKGFFAFCRTVRELTKQRTQPGGQQVKGSGKIKSSIRCNSVRIRGLAQIQRPRA